MRMSRKWQVLFLSLAGLIAGIGQGECDAVSSPVAMDGDPSGCAAFVAEARQLAAQGEAAGHLALGKYRHFGTCLQPDPEAARRHLLKAAELGLLCAPVVLETLREPTAGDAEMEASEVFRQCAFSLTILFDKSEAERMLGATVKPADIPRGMKQALDRMFDTVQHSPTDTFEIAKSYVGRGNLTDLRRAALSWLKTLARRESPIRPHVQYYLAKLSAGEGGDLVSEADGHMWLGFAARDGRVPEAQRDFALAVRRSWNDKQGQIRGYAWLLVARRNGLDVSAEMRDMRMGLDDVDLEAAEVISSGLVHGN